MADLIAVAGKGGVGKSTFSALLVRYLLKRNKPILAVDADPNSNLPVMLGLKQELTIGQVLEEFMSQKLKIPSGIFLLYCQG
jgi:CO dehydrogenase maturation factor